MINFGQEFKTTRYDIFNFWKDKVITKSGIAKDMSNMDTDCTIPIIDWGEPSCPCCHKPILVENENDYDKWLAEGNFEAIWNSLTMQRETKILGLAHESYDKPEFLSVVCNECYDKLTKEIKEKVKNV